MTNKDFIFCLLGLIPVCCILFAFLFFEIKETKFLINQQKSRRKNHRKFYEKLLLDVGDSQQIYNYFIETKEKLPEVLHNKMLANCLNDDYYAKMYIGYFDSNTGMIKKDNLTIVEEMLANKY